MWLMTVVSFLHSLLLVQGYLCFAHGTAATMVWISFNSLLLLIQDSVAIEEFAQLAAAAVSIAAAGTTVAAAGRSQLPFQQETWERCLPGQWHPLQLPVQCCPPLAAPPEQTSWGCPAYSSQSHDRDPLNIHDNAVTT